MSAARCSECWYAQKFGFDVFECRRHAPIAAHDPSKNCGVYEEAFVPRWPLMRAHQWCGDFVPEPPGDV